MINNTLARLVLVGSLTLSLQAEFLRDNTNEIVLDTKTNLMWQDNEAAKTNYQTWETAISYCEDLMLASHSDWRLPNINELETIVDDTRYNPANKKEFMNVNSNYYWSSTTNLNDATFASSIYFYDGFLDSGEDKGVPIYVRCVRDTSR